MQAADPVAHARALLLAARCPTCAELLPARALFRADACPHCDTGVDRHLGGRLAMDLRRQGRRRLLALAVIVGAAHLMLGWVPLVSAAVLVLAAIWIRAAILQPATVLLAPRRRVVTRWTVRLLMSAALAVTVIVVEALSVLPVVGVPIKALIGAAEVTLAAWAVTAYVHWQVDREARLQDIAGWELAMLGVCVAVGLACLTALGLALLAMTAILSIMSGWLT